MAQQTRANLASDQATNLADSSDITAAELRGEFTDLTDSALLREDIDTIAELNAIVADATIVTQGGALGTPSSGVATNLTGTASGLTAGTVTTNANLTGHVTSTGNAAVLGSFTVAQLNTALSDGTINTPEGTAVLSTGEGGGTKFLREDGDGTCSWQAVPGGITVTSGAGAPSSTPAAVGDIYVDTTADTTYNATGTASSADWTLNLDENSGTVLTDTAVATGDSIVFFDVDDSDNAKQRLVSSAITDLGIATLTASETLTNKTIDGQGNEIANYTARVLTSVSGVLTVAAHSGNILKTSGNVTVPTTAGFICTLIAGGSHTVTFNGTTSAAMGTGDVMSVIVESGTVIHAASTASADKVTFS